LGIIWRAQLCNSIFLEKVLKFFARVFTAVVGSYAFDCLSVFVFHERFEVLEFLQCLVSALRYTDLTLFGTIVDESYKISIHPFDIIRISPQISVSTPEFPSWYWILLGKRRVIFAFMHTSHSKSLLTFNFSVSIPNIAPLLAALHKLCTFKCPNLLCQVLKLHFQTSLCCLFSATLFQHLPTLVSYSFRF